MNKILTELSHMVQEQAEDPKAPNPGCRLGYNGNQKAILFFEPFESQSPMGKGASCPNLNIHTIPRTNYYTAKHFSGATVTQFRIHSDFAYDLGIMIHRLLIEDLTEWSKRKNRKPLVLRGARQVGKICLQKRLLQTKANAHCYSLLNGYNEDVEKYAKNANQVNVIHNLLTHGWTEAGQTITFNRFEGSNYTSEEVHEALEVLQNAFLLSLDYPITTMKTAS